MFIFVLRLIKIADASPSLVINRKFISKIHQIDEYKGSQIYLEDSRIF